MFGESLRVVVEGGDAGGGDGLVVETEPSLIVGGAAEEDVRDEVAAVHGAGVVGRAVESVLGGVHSGGALVVRLFQVGRHVQDLRDEDLVVAFSVSCLLSAGLGVLEARDADEEDFRHVAETVPDAACLALFGESFAFGAGEVDLVG